MDACLLHMCPVSLNIASVNYKLLSHFRACVVTFADPQNQAHQEELFAYHVWMHLLAQIWKCVLTADVPIARPSRCPLGVGILTSM